MPEIEAAEQELLLRRGQPAAGTRAPGLRALLAQPVAPGVLLPDLREAQGQIVKLLRRQPGEAAQKAGFLQNVVQIPNPLKYHRLAPSANQEGSLLSCR